MIDKQAVRMAVAEALAGRGMLPSEFEEQLDTAAVKSAALDVNLPFLDPQKWMGAFKELVGAAREAAGIPWEIGKVVVPAAGVAAGAGGYLLAQADKPSGADVDAVREEDIIRAYHDEIERIRRKKKLNLG